MPVIVGFISQKGGVGKSTLSRALAVMAANNGLKVRVADLDLQQLTVVKWGDLREARGLEPALDVKEYATAEKAIKDAADCDLLILDGPARTSIQTLTIAKQADLIVQPTRPRKDDLDPAIKTFYGLAKEGIDKNRMALAIVGVHTESEERQARDYIDETGFQHLPGRLYTKAAYGHAQDGGGAVIETPYKSLNNKAIELIEGMIDVVMTMDEKELKAGAA